MKYLVSPLIVLIVFYTTSNGMYDGRRECKGAIGLNKVGLQTLLQFERGEKLNRDPIRGQLLIFAALNGNSDLVQEILLGVSDKKQREILKNKFNGNFSLFSFLLRQCVVGNQRPYEEAALMRASQKGYTEIIEQLLAFGTNINVQCDYLRLTPLMCAAKNGHTGSVSLLITNKANLELTDCEGKTALDHAQENSRDEIVKLLEEAKITQPEEPLQLEQDGIPD